MSDRPPLPKGVGPRGGRDYWSQTPPWFVAIAGALLVAILVAVILLLIGDDDTQIQTVAPTLAVEDSTAVTLPTTSSTGAVSSSSTTNSSSTSTSASSSTTSSSTTATSTTTTGSTTSTVDPEEYRSAVWPWVDSSVRYNQPVAAAEGFAVDFLGFQNPLIGPFLQGDGRSGEVEIRPTADGPVTTVLVRLLGSDDSWWVLGSVTDNIIIGEPDVLEEIESPLTISGSALAFEGSVDFELRSDGSDSALIDSFVTGGGTTMEPFEGRFEWTNPGSGAGALVLMTTSMDDGRPWEAAVRRVVFASG